MVKQLSLFSNNEKNKGRLSSLAEMASKIPSSPAILCSIANENTEGKKTHTKTLCNHEFGLYLDLCFRVIISDNKSSPRSLLIC